MRKLEEWIDFMEGECTPQELSKLGLLLKHSISDQVVLDNLRRLRRATKACDPAHEIEHAIADENLMADLHSRTMKRISASLKMRAREAEAPAATDEVPVSVVYETLET